MELLELSGVTLRLFAVEGVVMRLEDTRGAPEETEGQADEVAVVSRSEELTEAEVAVIRRLRARGFAVIVWTPDELGAADADAVEDRSIELGWDVIEDLS